MAKKVTALKPFALESGAAIVHGRSVHYMQAGSGPVVLLVHGMAGNAENWQAVIEPLARAHTVIAPDLPGHGTSEPGAGTTPWAALPRDCAICCSPWATTGRPWSATRSAAASRCSSPTSSPRWSSDSSSSPAVASARR